jgi:hypothetical protein
MVDGEDVEPARREAYDGARSPADSDEISEFPDVPAARRDVKDLRRDMNFAK